MSSSSWPLKLSEGKSESQTQETEQSLEEFLGKPWFDSSKINTFRACPTKYFYRYKLHLVPIGAPSTHISFGAAIHLGLEEIHRPGGDPDEKVEYMGKLIPKYLALFLENFPEEYESGYKTRNTGVALLIEYRRKWGEEPFKVHTAEQSAVIDMGDFCWITKMDLFIDWNGEDMPMDHKTTSRFDNRFEGSFRIDVQITGYIIAARHLTGKDIKKACINALRATKNIDTDSFLRKFTSRRPDELERWFEEIKHTVEDINHCERDGFYPQYGHSCYMYGAECEYRGICLASPQQKAELIQANYTIEVWEPTIEAK